MQTECSQGQLEFEGVGKRRVLAAFDAGRTTSDGGVLLLREIAEKAGMLRRLARCFRDHRDPDRTEHSVEELLAQRVLGIACGYEDLNDHDTLRDDPLLATAAGKQDPTGAERARDRDRGHGLAGKSTLNRLEQTPAGGDAADRYHKIDYDAEAIAELWVDLFLDAHEEPPEHIVLDLDATDDPLHGAQEGRFFHGYYRSYCYLPLYIFCGDFLLCARLRPSNIDGSAGALVELERIVSQIRARWPEVEIWIRADSGFARDEIMRWCESTDVEYVLGLARNVRLQEALEEEMEEVRTEQTLTGGAVRRYKDFRYRTHKSWSRERRVVGKAERLPGKDNPRFVVTSLGSERVEAARLYQEIYCARGDMENRIKEQQLDLFATRTSTATLRGNQLRLWLSSMAYVLVSELRRVGLRETPLARAQAGTIRTRLLKIGGVVTVSVRRIVVALSSVYPLQALFRQILRNIQQAYPSAI